MRTLLSHAVSLISPLVTYSTPNLRRQSIPLPVTSWHMPGQGDEHRPGPTKPSVTCGGSMSSVGGHPLQTGRPRILPTVLPLRCPYSLLGTTPMILLPRCESVYSACNSSLTLLRIDSDCRLSYGVEGASWVLLGPSFRSVGPTNKQTSLLYLVHEIKLANGIAGVFSCIS